jgi:AAA domain
VHLTRLTLTNFGPFRDVAVDFPASGVCVVSGPNASGKSQLIGAAISVIVGERAIGVLPDGCGPTRVSLELRDERIEEVASLEVKVAASNKGSSSSRPEIVHIPTPLTQDLLSRLRLNAPPRVLLTEDGKVERLSRRELEEFATMAPPEVQQMRFWRGLRESGWLESGVHSAGVGIVIDVVREYIARRNAVSLPLLVDGIFSQLDSSALDFGTKLLLQIGLDSQVVLVTPSYVDNPIGRELIRLPQHESPLRALAHYVRPEHFRESLPKRGRRNQKLDSVNQHGR